MCHLLSWLSSKISFRYAVYQGGPSAPLVASNRTHNPLIALFKSVLFLFSIFQKCKSPLFSPAVLEFAAAVIFPKKPFS